MKRTIWRFLILYQFKYFLPIINMVNFNLHLLQNATQGHDVKWLIIRYQYFSTITFLKFKTNLINHYWILNVNNLALLLIFHVIQWRIVPRWHKLAFVIFLLLTEFTSEIFRRIGIVIDTTIADISWDWSRFLIWRSSPEERWWLFLQQRRGSLIFHIVWAERPWIISWLNINEWVF